MPSRQLHSIIDHIEGQKTDDFGKFYLYVSLLHKVAIDDNKTFGELIPKKTGGFFSHLVSSGNKPLHIGQLAPEISGIIDNYGASYRLNGSYDPFESAQNILLAYIRKGKLSDLTEIIDRMYQHLSAVYETNLNKDNQQIFKGLNFGEKKPKIEKFLLEISKFNHLCLSGIDSSANVLISATVAIGGAIIILASGLAALPMLIGAALVAGGVISAYSQFKQTEELVNQFEQQGKLIEKQMKQLPLVESFFGSTSDHKSFILSIMWPLAFSIPTALDSVLLFDNWAKESATIREDLNKMMSFSNSVL